METTEEFQKRRSEAMRDLPFEHFEWESDVQKKSFYAFLKWAHDNHLPQQVTPIDLFMFQKNHEANQYFMDVVAGHISRLENHIALLQSEIRELKEGN